VRQLSWASRGRRGLSEADRANSSLPVPRAAAFAIAGPLLDDRVVITNNKWDFSAPRPAMRWDLSDSYS